jgi:hypothetical protein
VDIVETVPDEGPMRTRVLDGEHAHLRPALSRAAYGRLDAAQMKTPWGSGHRRRYALVGRSKIASGKTLLASARQHDWPAVLDGRAVRVCAISAAIAHTPHGRTEDVATLVDALIDDTARGGFDVAIVLCEMDAAWGIRARVEGLAIADVELRVTESPRRGAPMTLVRGGEERDLDAIAAMGKTRSAAARFHLDRNVDFVRDAIMGKRLLAGFGAAGGRQLHFFIAEEGITAAAYVVVSVEAGTWTLEECGDRDPSGARVGAILQALIAREPMENRPTLRAWLPHGFRPPQVNVVATQQPPTKFMLRALGEGAAPLHLSAEDVLLWRGDWT